MTVLLPRQSAAQINKSTPWLTLFPFIDAYFQYMCYIQRLPSSLFSSIFLAELSTDILAEALVGQEVSETQYHEICGTLPSLVDTNCEPYSAHPSNVGRRHGT